MADEWIRTHSNGWIGWVKKVAELGGRYVASAAPGGETRSGSDHATPELAKAASDAGVREATGHQCSSACDPWHEG
jgi:hypothetical protein